MISDIRRHSSRKILFVGHNQVWVKAAREGVALLPSRHHGVLRMRGKDRLEFLHNYTTNEIKRLSPGEGCTTAISNWRGTVTDFVRTLVRPDDLLIVGTPGRQGAVRRALEQFIIGVDVAIDDLSDQVAGLDIGGPQALHALPAARDLALDAHRSVQFAPPLIELAEADNPLAELDDTSPADAEEECNVTSGIVVRTTGFHGGGVLVLVPRPAEGAMRDRLRRLGATAIGDEAWELVRLEEGIPEFGRDIGEDTNVWEARLDRSVSLEKGCYLGQEIVARLHNYAKVQRFLMGLRLPGEAPVTPGTPVLAEDGAQVGTITSAAADFEGGVRALAMIRAGAAPPGARVSVEGRVGLVVDLPYWSKLPV